MACATTTVATNGINAIFFDLDNTLIPTRYADKLTCSQLVEILQQKYGVKREQAAVICRNFLRTFRKCPENESMSLDEWRRLLWVEALGELYAHVADEIYGTWLKLRYEYLQPPKAVYDLLLELRKFYLLGLITNGTSAAQWEKIEQLQLQPIFDVILVSGDLPWEKPHEKIFQEACNFLGVSSETCIMVGDKLETDILGGTKAGFAFTIWLRISDDISTAVVPLCTPDYEITNIMQLRSILPKNPKKVSFRSRNFPLPDLDDSNSNSSDCS